MNPARLFAPHDGELETNAVTTYPAGMVARRAQMVSVGAVIVMVIDGLTAAGVTPLAASIVNVKLAAVVGVPDTVPVVESRVSPLGSDHELTENVGAGLPDAAKVYV